MKDINGIKVAAINYMETSRGVAYVAPILMDEKPIGKIENLGDGGMTRMYIDFEVRSEFYKRKDEYFREQGIPIYEDGRDFEIFADHLIDVKEFGRVLTDEEKLKLLLEEN